MRKRGLGVNARMGFEMKRREKGKEFEL